MDKKYLAGLCLGLYGTAALAACPYPLDATADQLSKYGVKPFPVRSGQSVAFTVQDNSATPFGLRYGAASSAGAKAYLGAQKTGVADGDVKLPASGIVALEFRFDAYAAFAPNSSPAFAGLGFGVSSGNTGSKSTGPMLDLQLSLVDENSAFHPPHVQVDTRVRNSTGAPVLSGHTEAPLTLPLAADYRLGLYLDRSNGRIGYTVNGSDQGYLRDGAGNPLLLPASLSVLSLGVGGGNAGILPGDVLVGTTLSGSLITDAAQMTQPYPAGSSDICAVPLTP